MWSWRSRDARRRRLASFTPPLIEILAGRLHVRVGGGNSWPLRPKASCRSPSNNGKGFCPIKILATKERGSRGGHSRRGTGQIRAWSIPSREVLLGHLGANGVVPVHGLIISFGGHLNFRFTFLSPQQNSLTHRLLWWYKWFRPSFPMVSTSCRRMTSALVEECDPTTSTAATAASSLSPYCRHCLHGDPAICLFLFHASL